MYLTKKASRARLREAQTARNNRQEIVKALSIGQITRRDLIKWGAMTAGGALAFKHGLHPFVRSAYAQTPTGLIRSPLFGVQKFTQPMPRLDVQHPINLIKVGDQARWGLTSHGLPNAKRYSYHEDFNQFGGPAHLNPYRNPVTNRGPMEGRPPGDFFKHQRWDEFFPEQGYVMSWASATGVKFHPGLPGQTADKVWSYSSGKVTTGTLPPPLIKLRYGEPSIMRIYNNTPADREHNGGFGRNETQLHFHNAHNGAESDGATGAAHFPGTFYDYLWSTVLARHDTINTDASDIRAAAPRNNYGVLLPGVKKVPGDFRELQGTMWIHDHRFFFTAENVYKGALGMVNMYSGRDRGHELVDDGGNLRLPSGILLPWGNVDFDVNLIISDGATDPEGQYAFDLSTNPGLINDGFLADMPLVNFAYAPYFEVLPRKYRFRILNAAMSRFFKLALAHQGNPVPFTFIANDGNFVVNPIPSSAIAIPNQPQFAHQLDEQGTAERYDIIVDFSAFPVGATIQLVNTLRMRPDGRGPLNALPLTLAEALAGDPTDPVIGPIMEFRVVSSVQSVDIPGVPLTVHNSCGSHDKSRVPLTLTEQIPIVPPVRTRTLTFGRGAVDSRDPVTGECTPDCSEEAVFNWTIRVNNQDTHSFNANRVSLVLPQPGEVEHWTLVGGGTWDHPVHMHFEEGVTMNRGNEFIPITELNVRKDVWRLGHQPQVGRSVTFQVRFGEFGGSYVTHCHNTVHEDFAMLLRMQILAALGGTHSVITPTPIPSPDGVHFLTPDILPEGDPRTTI